MTYEMIQFPLLCSISFASYWLFNRLRFPASRLVGPIVSIALLQSFGLSFEVPLILKTAFSAVFGVYLGLRFNRNAVSRLRASLVPALVISVLYIGITLFYGDLLTRVSMLDQTTAFLAVIPGGVAEASVLAVSYNADLAQVSSFQLVRFLSIVMIVPLFAQWVLKPQLKEKNRPEAVQVVSSDDDGDLETLNVEPPKADRFHWLWLFLIGGAGSFVFYKLHLPAALLIGGTFSVSAALIGVRRGFGAPPQVFYNLAQIGMGAVIGTSFTQESLRVIATLTGPMLLLTVLIMSTSMLLGLLFTKLFKWDFMTGFMSAIPGGMSAMVILADEFDADVVTITTMQLVRLLTAVMVIPFLYQVIL